MRAVRLTFQERVALLSFVGVGILLVVAGMIRLDKQIETALALFDLGTGCYFWWMSAYLRGVWLRQAQSDAIAEETWRKIREAQ